MTRCRWLAPLYLLCACSTASNETAGTDTSITSATAGPTGSTTTGGTDTTESGEVTEGSSGESTTTGDSEATTEEVTSDTETTDTGGTDTTDGTTDPTTDASTTDASTTDETDTGATTEEDQSIPVHEIPGLVSITFYERTGGDEPTAYTFTVLGPELTTQLADPLTGSNRDIQGTPMEFYDVHYSDVDGNFDVDGSYLTIAGVFPNALPSGGGLNLAEISLNYEDNSVEYGSFLASFVALGDNAAPDSAPLAIDGDLQTHTTMGNTKMDPDKRLRVTLGFESSLVPE